MPRLIHQRRLQPPTTCAKRNDKYPRDDSDDLYDVKLDGEDDWPQVGGMSWAPLMLHPHAPRHDPPTLYRRRGAPSKALQRAWQT